MIVLAGLQDPGNLGTILRSAEAFGATGVVSLPGTVSAWNPKAVRASAGSVFRVPLVSASLTNAFARLREAGVEVLTTTAPTRPARRSRATRSTPVALLIGNEGNGVPENCLPGRRRDHDSLPRAGRKPERSGGGRRAAL